MKEEIARIHGHTDAIRRSTAELIAELDALPQLATEESVTERMDAISQELSVLTGDAVCVEITCWHHGHEGSEIEFRIWLACLSEYGKGTSLEEARAKAVSAWEARQVTA